MRFSNLKKWSPPPRFKFDCIKAFSLAVYQVLDHFSQFFWILYSNSQLSSPVITCEKISSSKSASSHSWQMRMRVFLFDQLLTFAAPCVETPLMSWDLHVKFYEWSRAMFQHCQRHMLVFVDFCFHTCHYCFWVRGNQTAFPFIVKHAFPSFLESTYPLKKPCTTRINISIHKQQSFDFSVHLPHIHQKFHDNLLFNFLINFHVRQKLARTTFEYFTLAPKPRLHTTNWLEISYTHTRLTTW